jgi:hypothetical protein
LIKSDNVFRQIGWWLHFLSEKDIADLAKAWDGDDPHDDRCAGGVLRALALKRDPRLSRAQSRVHLYRETDKNLDWIELYDE